MLKTARQNRSFSQVDGVEVAPAGEQRREVLGADERAGRPSRMLAAAGRRVVEVEDDRQEGEQAEDDEVGGEEQPGDPLLPELALREPHRRLEQVEAARADGSERHEQQLLQAGPGAPGRGPHRPVAPRPLTAWTGRPPRRRRR